MSSSKHSLVASGNIISIHKINDLRMQIKTETILLKGVLLSML